LTWKRFLNLPITFYPCAEACALTRGADVGDTVWRMTEEPNNRWPVACSDSGSPSPHDYTEKTRLPITVVLSTAGHSGLTNISLEISVVCPTSFHLSINCWKLFYCFILFLLFCADNIKLLKHIYGIQNAVPNFVFEVSSSDNLVDCLIKLVCLSLKFCFECILVVAAQLVATLARSTKLIYAGPG